MYIATYLIIYDLYTQYKKMSIYHHCYTMYNKFTLLKQKRQPMLKPTLKCFYLCLIMLCLLLSMVIKYVIFFIFYFCVLGHSVSSYANALLIILFS